METTLGVTRGRYRSGWVEAIKWRVLGVPLVAKLIGANVLIVLAAVAVQSTALRWGIHAEIVAFTALAIAMLVNFMLVRIALEPIHDLEELAARVLAGDFGARSRRSPFADAALARLGAAVNGLLDALATERRRIQKLGAEIVFAQDSERARIAYELHESVAQTLTAASFQVSAAGIHAEGDMKDHLSAGNALLSEAMDQLKLVSYSLHPRVAQDLGLEAALCHLARQIRERSGIIVHVHMRLNSPPVPSNVSATLFRVAQEALRNIEVHSKAKYANVEVISQAGSVRLEVADDGCGFDPQSISNPALGSGFASVKDRLILAGGDLLIDSVPDGGTRVTAILQTGRAA